MIWKNKWTFEEAFDYVKSKREKLKPNPGFKKQIIKFAEEIASLK